MCIEGVRMNEKNGSVIILNGISSSGKSTLAKELQSCLGNNYLHCQIDSFLKCCLITLALRSSLN